MNTIQYVTVAGGGVLGSQIAFQSAVKGKDVTIWLREPSSITRTQPKLDKLLKDYTDTLNSGMEAPGLAGVSLEDIKSAPERIHIELDMEKALSKAQILIEAISENAELKRVFFDKARPFIREDIIVATNSSTLLPSDFVKDVPYPKNLLALHFANHIWINNLAEVMAQPQTSPEVFEDTLEFARSIGMDPVAVRKEKSGYLLNSMLVPFLMAAQDLLVTGTADVKDIDLAWTKGTGAPIGPFRMLDIIGAQTALNIVKPLTAIPDAAAPFH